MEEAFLLDGKRAGIAGQAFHVPPGTVHYVRVLGDTPVHIVAFWVVEKGKPPMQPVKK